MLLHEGACLGGGTAHSFNGGKLPSIGSHTHQTGRCL